MTYADNGNPATVSDFRLDSYEITVGRFRKFVAAYPASKPAAGAGKNPNNASDPGWDTAWSAEMPPDQAALVAAVKCNSTSGTWTDSPGSSETLPMNCISWYEAFAFCIWDGGRLPTEAEWNYAATGGSDQRVYPWSSPATSTTIDDSYAVFCGGSCDATKNVGSRSPKGDARWGQADMAGNVAEWVLDSNSAYVNPCSDCADTNSNYTHIIRGGSFSSTSNSVSPYETNVFAQSRDHGLAATRSQSYGARCARSPE